MVNALQSVLDVIDKIREEAEIQHADALENGLPTVAFATKVQTCFLISMLVRDIQDNQREGSRVVIGGRFYIVPENVAKELRRLQGIEFTCKRARAIVGRAVAAMGSVNLSP